MLTLYYCLLTIKNHLLKQSLETQSQTLVDTFLLSLFDINNYLTFTHLSENIYDAFTVTGKSTSATKLSSGYSQSGKAIGPDLHCLVGLRALTVETVTLG